MKGITSILPESKGYLVFLLIREKLSGNCSHFNSILIVIFSFNGFLKLICPEVTPPTKVLTNVGSIEVGGIPVPRK